MNKILLNKTDSHFFKQDIVAWNVEKVTNTEDLRNKEKDILEKYDPAMITAFLPASGVKLIAHFSACNYQFIECRLLVEKEIEDSQSNYNLFPYEFIEVSNRQQLYVLKEKCLEMTFDDRFFNDPQVENQLAIKRILFFLEQSYKRKSEFIYLLQNSYSKEILGFRSFKVNSKTEVSMLISGTIKEKQKENIQEFINLFELELLHDMNIRTVKAVISVQNFDEINRYISTYAYKIYDSKILLRKILKPLD